MRTSNLILYLNVFLGIIILGTAIFSFPFAMSAFHMYQGASALDQALRPIGVGSNAFDVTTLNYETFDREALSDALLAHSLSSLQQAVDWDRQNSRAYPLLIQVYFLRGDYAAASAALARYSDLKPEDPWISRMWIAIGNGYEAQGQWDQAVMQWQKAGLSLRQIVAEEFLASGQIRIAAQALHKKGDDKMFQDIGESQVILFTDSTLSQLLFFPASSNYEVIVRGRNSVVGPVKLVLEVDGQAVGDILLARIDDSWEEKSVQIRVPRGVHRLGISFVNDYSGPDGDRNAQIEWIELRKPENDPPYQRYPDGPLSRP